MQKMIKILHPDGKLISFNESTHKYYYDGKLINNSVTKVINQYWPPFDTSLADKCAGKGKYEKYTPNEVRQIWKNLGRSATKLGSNVHNFVECYIKNEKLPIPNNAQEWNRFLSVKDYINKWIKDNYEIVGIEMIIILPRFNIAGMIDMLLKSKSNKNEYIIYDWKTNNKPLDNSNIYNTGLGPLNKLGDTPLNHYRVQLNMYKMMLKLGKYVDKNSEIKMKIVQINENNCKEFILKDLNKECSQIFENLLVNNE